MFNLDMVGTYSQYDEVYTYGLLDGTPARDFFNARRGNYNQYNFTRVGRHAPSYDSDFESFCDEGIPYFYYETPDPCWHEACDDTPRLDFDAMGDLVRLKYEVAVDLANTSLGSSEHAQLPRQPLTG